MKPLLQRIMPKIHINPVTHCWEWTASRQSGGYAQIMLKRPDGKFAPQVVHRVMWELTKGPIPEGLTIDHLCRVRYCVNPDHMEVVTQQVNILRGTSKSALNAVKTHCKRGHPLSGPNLYINPKGQRNCKTCRKMLFAEFRRTHPTYNRDYKRAHICPAPGKATPP